MEGDVKVDTHVSNKISKSSTFKKSSTSPPEWNNLLNTFICRYIEAINVEGVRVWHP